MAQRKHEYHSMKACMLNKGMLKGAQWNTSTPNMKACTCIQGIPHFPPSTRQGVLRHGERTSARRWAWGSIGLDAGHMGGGESVVGIASKQVSSGFDGVNHSEWADPLAHEGFSETTPPDWGVNKDFGGINISRGNSTQVVVPLLALLCNL